MNETDQFTKEILICADRIQQLLDRDLPIKMGKTAKRHFQDNFLQGGFVDGGLHPWPPAIRQSQGGTSADAKRKTLLSSERHLYSGINYTPGVRQVRVFNDVPYAAVHQYGCEIPITDRMRRYAWHRYFEAIGKGKGKQEGKKRKTTPKRQSAQSGPGSMWKGLALTKKSHVKIPARPFIGPSKELEQKLEQLIDKEI